MKHFLFALGISLLTQSSWAENNGAFCGEEIEEDEEQVDPDSYHPKQILIQTESIEVNTADITHLLFGKKLERSGSAIRADIQKLIDAKKAKITHNTAIIARPGESARHQSALQTIYPTEYSRGFVKPTQLNADGKVISKAVNYCPTAESFEERPVGSCLEICPTMSFKDWRNMNLAYDSEYNKRLPNLVYRNDKEGKMTHKVFMPSFANAVVKNSINLRDLKTQLVAVHSVFDIKGKALTHRKTVQFVKASIIITRP